MKLLSYLSLIAILTLTLACTETVVPNKILLYQNIVMTNNETVSIIAYDISKKPFETYLLLTDWQNNTKYEKTLGDSLVFVGSIEQNDTFSVLFSTKGKFTSYLLDFNSMGVLQRTTSLPLEAISLKQTNYKSILIGGQSEIKEASLIELDENLKIIKNQVVKGTNYRDSACANRTNYSLVYDVVSSKSSIYTGSHQLLYQFDTLDNEPCKLSIFNNQLRIHYLNRQGVLKITDISDSGKEMNQIDINVNMATNFSMIQSEMDTYYSIIHKSLSGPSHTKLYRLENDSLIEVKSGGINMPTLARLYAKYKNVVACYFTLSDKGPLNGFTVIK